MKEDLYPNMFWDSEKIRDCRIQVQKPWVREEFWSYYFSRRISIYLSLFLAKRKGVSPNAITIAGIAAGLIAAAAFMYGSAGAFLIGCFFYQMCYLADCVDGEVARIKNQNSAGGVWLDIGLNYSLYLVSFSVIYGVASSQPTLGPYLIYLILFTIFTEILATNGSALAFGQGKISHETVSMRKRSRWLDAGVFLFLTQTGFQSGVLIAALMWAFSGQHQFLDLWTGYHLLVGLLRALYKLKLNIKYVTSSRQEGGEAHEGSAHGGRTRIKDQRAN
ncbi:CDP-alcohol phosphatidyltransferase family protein [Brevibacillus parabrevis]|uniref:CDP-alcohol phosphatidyltransferase family protein n=1 Tax=Brevibacillus parabrevis TaxID=54914 RepID=UPI0028D72D27|nr:CDP-alcohol phosphatidyltransferase family protein [Brevibacillus parabrevis]MED1723594.1 CDP-alcohol phosphatidyltransferase family protein [Brevibacillus parabrevis]